MAFNQTDRHAIPFLAVSQAQKELTHNEALTRIDALLHPVVESEIASPPVPLPDDAGKCWLIGVGATGVWQGKSGQIACWVGGGWRYLIPVDAMRIWNKSTATDIIWVDGQWVSAPTVSDPVYGAVIDVEARVAIAALLSHFRTIGQVTS